MCTGVLEKVLICKVHFATLTACFTLPRLRVFEQTGMRERVLVFVPIITSGAQGEQ